MQINLAQYKLIQLIKQYPQTMPIDQLIADLTKRLQNRYPMVHHQITISHTKFDTEIVGLWQRLVFSTDIQYGQTYLDNLATAINPDNDLDEEQAIVFNRQTYINENGANNWYLLDTHQYGDINILTVDRLIDLIQTTDVDATIPKMTDWYNLYYHQYATAVR